MVEIDANKYLPVRDALLQTGGIQLAQTAYEGVIAKGPFTKGLGIFLGGVAGIGQFFLPLGIQEGYQAFGTKRGENGSALSPALLTAGGFVADLSFLLIGIPNLMEKFHLGESVLPYLGIKAAESLVVNYAMNHVNNGINRRFLRKNPPKS